MAKVRYGGGRFVFFTDPAIEKAVSRSVAAGLSKWGAYVRRSARQSIKKRKGPSKPGNPPHSHEGSLKALLNFYFDKVTKTVVVGPEIKPASTGAPNTLEFGGHAVRGPQVIDKVFKIGETGPIKKERGPNGRNILVWTKLTTPEQAALATKLYKEHSLQARKRKQFYVASRPYMRPAMMKNLHVAPVFFKASLKGN